MGSLASINIKFKADVTGFSTEMQNAMRNIEKMGGKLQSLGQNLSFLLTAPLAGAGIASVKLASDMEESLNKVNVAFGESSGYVKGWAKDSLTSFGIAEGTAVDMAALFGDMATSMGLSQPAAAKMSTSLVGLAGDLASFKNIGIEEATTALNGIFTGETESLKRLGVVMTEANLSAYALSQGINKQVKDMTEAEKVQLRYSYVLEKTKNAQGDFERTGGGAANQMRVFSESLKELGVSFGQIILPYFTKLITSVNSAVSSFRNLSDSTKTTIVVVAGLTAVIGPLLYGIGTLVAAIPSVIAGFAAIRNAFNSLMVTMAANPFTALAVALSAIVGVLLVSNSRFTELTNSEKEFATITAKATDSIAKEKAEVDKLIATAKNKNLSDQTRLDAVKQLNAISPEYLGNISLENIYTKESENAVKSYTSALLTKAKVMAAEEKLVEVQKKLLDLQLGQSEAANLSVWQNLKATLASAGNAYGFTAKQIEYMTQNIITENTELTKLQNKLTSFVNSNKKYAESNNEASTSLKDLISTAAEGPQVGSVSFYERQIKDLEKFRDEHNFTATQYSVYADKIKEIQDKINKIKDPTPIVNSLDNLNELLPSTKTSAEQLKIQENEALIESYRELQKTQVEGSYKWLEYEGLIKQAEKNINDIKLSVGFDTTGIDTGLQKLQNLQDKTAETAAKQAEEQQKMAEIMTSIGQSVGDAFTTIGSNFVESMGLAKTGMEGFAAGILQTITKLIAMALSASIAQSIQGAVQSGTASGPAAVFTTPAFIATAVGGVLAAFAAIPKFATGGIVGGNSMYGDKILARVNSGELIMNQKQQANLYGMMNATGGADEINLVGGFEVSGDKLQLVLDRALKRKKRIG